jgi:hypothetical protein
MSPHAGELRDWQLMSLSAREAVQRPWRLYEQAAPRAQPQDSDQHRENKWFRSSVAHIR